MAKKQKFVQAIRPAKGDEANNEGIKKFDIKAPIYSADIIDRLNDSDKAPDTVRKIMAEYKPKNVVVRAKAKIDGFANPFQLFAQNDNKAEYTDVTGVHVDVVAILDNNVAMFGGTIERQDGLTVFVLEDTTKTYVLCPTQRDCWFFN